MQSTRRVSYTIPSSDLPVFGTAYDPAKKLEFPLYVNSNSPEAQWRPEIYLSSMYLRGTIAGGATKVTVVGYDNAAGTGIAVVPATEVTIDPALTGTSGTIALVIRSLVPLPNKRLYLFAKTDAGTFTILESKMLWEE